MLFFATFAAFAVKIFNREERKGNRKGRKDSSPDSQLAAAL
jgi:hypothetical protein